VEEVKGFIGNFEVKIRRKATSVNNALCTGCGACQAACVVKKVRAA
ncbi:MAG: 4Fe-4S binding protein, partial [Planctomycetota bacterium]|nr:4Fe-4S binding protein [Planctomycetota bacterium]